MTRGEMYKIHKLTLHNAKQVERWLLFWTFIKHCSNLEVFVLTFD